MPSDKEYWYNHKSKPPLHVCVEYNTEVYLRMKSKASDPKGHNFKGRPKDKDKDGGEAKG